MSKRTVGVFFGSNSNEHEISVITGMLAVNLLRTEYEVIPVYLPREGGMVTGSMRGVEDFRGENPKKFHPIRLKGRSVLLDKGRGKRLAEIDCALNCCHGGHGEDGTLSALLEWNGIPSASPDAVVSAVFMDKALGKIAAEGLQIPVLPAFCAWEGEDAVERAEALGYPVIVKPVKLGSSIGIKVAHDADELARALEFAFRLDERALVEKYLSEKRDLNCAVCRVNGKTVTSQVEEIFSDEEILTFSEKYEGHGERKSAIPANIPEKLAHDICDFTRRIYEAFSCRGVMRADFLLVQDQVYFNELNTVPGSLSCYLFGDSLSESKAFLVSLVEEALSTKKAPKELLSSGILEQTVFSGRKGVKRR